MKLWIDDLRPAPEGWTWLKSSSTAILVLTLFVKTEIGVDEISLDHDLGGEDTTRPVVRWMAEHDMWPPVVRVHTQNNVGAEWLEGMINRYGPGVTR